MKRSRKAVVSKRSETPTQPRDEATPDAVRPRGSRLIVAGLLGGAFLIAVIMAWQAIAGRALAGCGPESGCNIVLASRWGSFLGIPVSVFGALVYGVLLVGEVQQRDRRALAAWLHTIAENLVLAGALWFFFVQAVLLKAFCPWCSAAHALACGGVLIAWFMRSKRETASGGPAVRPFSMRAVALPIAAVAGMAAIQAYGPEPERIRRVALADDTARGPAVGGGPTDFSGLPWIGAPGAAVTAMALTDFTCPHCRQLERRLSEVAEAAGGRFGVAMLPGYHDDAARELHRVMLALWKIDAGHYRRISSALVEGAIDANAAAVTAEAQRELGGRLYELAWPHGPWIEDTLRRGREVMTRNEQQLGLHTLPQLLLGGQAIAGVPARETLLSLIRATPAGTPAPSPVIAAKRAPTDAETAPLPPATKPPAGEGPRIAFESATIDLGRVTKGDTVPFVVRFTNTGTAPLEITKIKPSCACTTIAGGTQTVAPGQSGSFEMKFDSAHFVGPVSKSIAVEARDPRGSGSLTFKADVWTPVLVEPRMVLFGSVIRGTPVAPRTVAITVQDAESIAIGDVTCNNPYFQWKLATVEPGRRYALDVSIPELGDKAQQGEIRIPVGHSKLPVIAIPLMANPVDRVMVHPPAIVQNAAAGAPSQSLALRVDCHDPEWTKFEITGLAYAGEEDVKVALDMVSTRWGVVRIALPSGFDAAAAEARGAHIVFRTNHPAYPEMRVPIRTTDPGR